MSSRIGLILLSGVGAVLMAGLVALIVAVVQLGAPVPAGPVDDEAAVANGGVAIMGHATTYYGSIEEWAGSFDGAAIVRVISVSEPQWNTPDGQRPSAEALLARVEPSSTADYFIGRRVEVAVLRALTGGWAGPTGTYWLAGGTLGVDVTAVEAGLSSMAARPGATALAFTFDQARPFGTGVSTFIGDLMPIDKSGRLVSPDPSEQFTESQLAARLKHEVP